MAEFHDSGQARPKIPLILSNVVDAGKALNPWCVAYMTINNFSKNFRITVIRMKNL